MAKKLTPTADPYATRPNKREEVVHLEIAVNSIFSDHTGVKGDADLEEADRLLRGVIQRRKNTFVERTGVEWGYNGPGALADRLRAGETK